MTSDPRTNTAPARLSFEGSVFARAEAALSTYTGPVDDLTAKNEWLHANGCPITLVSDADYAADEQERAERRRAMLIQASGLRQLRHYEVYTPESFRVRGGDATALERVDAWLAQLGSPDAGRGLYLHGQMRRGKTWLAQYAARRFIETREAGARYASVVHLLEELREEMGTRGERGGLPAVLSVPLLVLDDLGAEVVSKWVLERLFELVDFRHARALATVYTSNLGLDELEAHLGPRPTGAITAEDRLRGVRTAERIREHCAGWVIEVGGPNLGRVRERGRNG